MDIDSLSEDNKDRFDQRFFVPFQQADAAASPPSPRKINDQTPPFSTTPPNDGTYRIVESEFPLVGNIGGHHLLAVLDASGNVVEELDGLATGSDGSIKPIGYLPSDRLYTYVTDGAYLYGASESQNTLFSGSFDQVMSRFNAAVEAGAEINDENLGYPILGFGKNSNSVASTLVDSMGLDEQPFQGGAPITPGTGSELLSNEQIAQIQSEHDLRPTYQGDETDTYDDQGRVATATFHDASGAELNEDDYSYSPDGQSGDILVKAPDGTVLETETFSLDPATGGITIDLIHSDTGNDDQYTEVSSFDGTTDALVSVTVSGHGDTIDGTHATVTLAGDGTEAEVSGAGVKIVLTADNQVVTTGALDNVTIGSNLSGLSIKQGGASVTAGDNVELTIDGGQFSLVTMGKNATLTVLNSQFGGQFTVGDGSQVVLGDGNSFASVNISNGTVVETETSGANVSGSGNVIRTNDVTTFNLLGDGNTFQGGVVGLFVNGNSNTATLADGSTISSTGTNETYNANSTSFFVSDGSSGTFNGSNNTFTFLGAGDEPYFINGDGNHFDADTGVTINVTGNSNVIDGAQGTVHLLSGDGNLITGFGINVDATAVHGGMFEGSGEIVTTASGTFIVSNDSDEFHSTGSSIVLTNGIDDFSLFGENNQLLSGDSDTVTVNGGDVLIGLTHSSVDATGLGAGHTITVSGLANTVRAAAQTIDYTGTHAGTADITVVGEGNTVEASGVDIAGSSGNTLTIDGSGNTLHANGMTLNFNDATSATIASSDDIVNIGKATIVSNGFSNVIHAGDGSDITVNTSGSDIHVNNATIHIADNTSLTIEGSGNTIIGGNDVGVEITGTNNTVTATNSVIRFDGANTGDTVQGAGDGGSNWSAPDGDLPPGDNGGWTPPTPPGTGAVAAHPDPASLVHAMAAFLGSQGDGGASTHALPPTDGDRHLMLAAA